jgi:tRNA dimethylallyltransferase
MDALKGILEQYGPLHNITDTVNKKRLIRAIEIAVYQHERKEHADVQRLSLPENSLVLGVRYDRESRRERITRRLKDRLSAGMVGEVAGLLEQGIPPEKLDYYGLEYRFVSRYILKEITYEEMFSGLNTAIHRFAKRQMTYFRGMERRGVRIHWLEGEMPPGKKIEKALALFETAT